MCLKDLIRSAENLEISGRRRLRPLNLLNYFVIRRSRREGNEIFTENDDSDLSNLLTLIEIGFFYWLIDFQMINQKKNFISLFHDYTPWIIQVRNNWYGEEVKDLKGELWAERAMDESRRR